MAKLFSYTRNGSLHFVAVWRFRVSFCMARETVAERDARRARAVVRYHDYLSGGYVVTFAERGDGSLDRMPGRAMWQDMERLPPLPAHLA